MGSQYYSVDKTKTFLIQSPVSAGSKLIGEIATTSLLVMLQKSHSIPNHHR
jgi:hypothetical protein